eukprot:361089-Chlamydomonas_euryale.AAC.2
MLGGARPRTNFPGGRCRRCPRRPDFANQPGHMGLARLMRQPGRMGLAAPHGCSLKQAFGHGPRQRCQTVRAWRNPSLERAVPGASFMFGRVGTKIAARTMCCRRQVAGGRRQSGLSAPWIKRA